MNKILIKTKTMKDRIFVIRDKQVMIDKDLAELYGVQTKVLNQAVKKNRERFPEDFMFQLTENEKKELVTNCDWLETLKHSPTPPYAFTEQGVSMLASVLRSKKAVEISIQIIRAFVAMKKFLIANAQILQRLDRAEIKLLEHDKKINQLFAKFNLEKIVNFIIDNH